MSNVNDNNLDDLLRRAAEKYPLRTDSADWDKLVSDLEKDPSLILPPVNGEDRRRRRRFFWLFLLLPLAGAGYYIWHTPGKSTLAVEKTMQAGQDGKAGQEKTDGAAVDGKNGQGGHVGGTSPVAGNEANGTDGQGSRVTGQDKQINGAAKQDRQINGTPQQDGQTGAATAGQGGHVGGTSPLTGNGAKTNGVAGDGGHVGGKDIAAGRNGQTGRNGQRAGRGGNTHGVAGNGGNVGGSTGNDPAVGGTDGSADGAARLGQTGLVNGPVKNGDNKIDDKELTLATNNVRRAAMKGNVAVNIPVQARTFPKDSTKKEKQIQKHSFYVGIMGSPDLSSIKFQSVKSAGTRFGVLFGYTLNDRWSMETGLSYGKKKYFTDGEYFNKEGANAGPYVLKYVQQLKIQGTCDMWEIPLNVRYNLTTGDKMKWFATAGVSTYYMSRENYDCWGLLYGNAWAKDWDITPTRNRWSANLNFSLGYEQKLGRIGNLRLEPYVRVPISGVGTGKLSIMSAGLNIGITRKLW